MYRLRILTLYTIATLLMACSPVEHDVPFVPEGGHVGISFGGNDGTWQDATTTQSTLAGGKGLETLFADFRVWGAKTTETSAVQTVMDGYQVQYRNAAADNTLTNTTGWEYVGIQSNQTIKFWDLSATSYRFFGYSPYDAQATVSTTLDESIAFSFPYTYTDQATATTTPYTSQLWFANDNTTYGNCVTLTFAPLIAKVRFRFTYPDGTEDIQIRDIQFGDTRFTGNPHAATTPLSGTIKVTYPLTGDADAAIPRFTWSTLAQGPLLLSIPYEVASDRIHILDDPKQYDKWYYVPPLDIIPYAQGPYTITANIDGSTVSTTVPSEFMQWKMGYQYTYVFKISGSSADRDISFENVQVEQWVTGKNIDNNGSGSGSGTQGW